MPKITLSRAGTSKSLNKTLPHALVPAGWTGPLSKWFVVSITKSRRANAQAIPTVTAIPSGAEVTNCLWFQFFRTGLNTSLLWELERTEQGKKTKLPIQLPRQHRWKDGFSRSPVNSAFTFICLHEVYRAIRLIVICLQSSYMTTRNCPAFILNLFAGCLHILPIITPPSHTFHIFLSFPRCKMSTFLKVDLLH